MNDGFARLRDAVRGFLGPRRTPRPPSPRHEPRTDAVARVEEALRRDTAESVAEAKAIGRDTRALSGRDLVRLAGRFLVTGHADLARELVDEAGRRNPAELSEGQRGRLEHLRAWTHPTDWPDAPNDAVQIGVFHYRQPDRPRGSKNIGDYVQTLSLLGNLARFSDVEFSGVDGLGELVSDLQTRVRPELRIRTDAARVHLVPVSRDFSRGDPVADGTWLPAFGWHLHTSFGLRYGLPYHAALLPLFHSFHLHALDALDEKTLDYLRAHGPIGCRDWATVDVLLSAGVDAFFTGCVTTTVDAVFTPLAEIDRASARSVGVVDAVDPEHLAPGEPIVRFTNADAAFRDLHLIDGTRAAVDLLEGYQTRLDRLVTSRLHAYLPATSLGLPVDFQPKIPGDARFTGLTGLTPGSPSLAVMRDGIRDLLADAFRRVIEGAPSEDVYAAWRARTRPLVEQARTRQRAAPPSYGPVSLPQAAARPGGAPTPDDVGVAVVVEGTIDVGNLPSAAGLLALPDLLPDVRRLVVLGAADAVRDTSRLVTRLARLDLGDRPVGARIADEPAAMVWRRAAERLSPEDAAELHRVLNARHSFSTRGLGTGPLVLDLEAMRSDGDRQESLDLAAHFGLDAREALLAYAGQRVAPLRAAHRA